MRTGIGEKYTQGNQRVQSLIARGLIPSYSLLCGFAWGKKYVYAYVPGSTYFKNHTLYSNTLVNMQRLLLLHLLTFLINLEDRMNKNY